MSRPSVGGVGGVVGGAVSGARGKVGRAGKRARNGARLATGGATPPVGQTPKDVVWRTGRSELWRYRGESGPGTGPPLLVVFSLFSKSYILDLRPGNSFVEHLLEAGFDVYLLDWGIADERDADNQLEDYVDDYLPAAIERVREVSDAEEVNVLGYCFGGTLALLHAAHHPEAPLRSLTVMATPADLHELGPLVDVLHRGGLETGTILDRDGNVPPRVVYSGFKALKPVATVTQYVDLWEKLWDDDYVAAHQAMIGWASDHVPLPGGVARQLSQMVRDNAFTTDQLVVGGDRVHLRDLRVPFMNVLAKRDHIVPEASAGPLLGLVGSPDKDEMRLEGGHVGLLVGRTAARTTIPEIIAFLRRASGSEAP